MSLPRWAASPGCWWGSTWPPASLELASRLGYTAVLADAAHTPFRSGVADIVAINASLHHCDDMDAVLREGARLVKSDGLLITDHDPQLTAWDYKGLAKWMWDARLWVYRATRRGFHKTGNQQSWGLSTEVHHRPGDGVTRDFFGRTLEPLGFEVGCIRTTTRSARDALQGRGRPRAMEVTMGDAGCRAAIRPHRRARCR